MSRGYCCPRCGGRVDALVTAAIRTALKAQSAKGGRTGGVVRAQGLPAARRREIARLAATTRWAKVRQARARQQQEARTGEGVKT